MILQLDPPIIMLTPKGKAVCHFLLDYGYETDLFWVCFQHDTNECWTWNNKEIRIDNNSTAGRMTNGSPINAERKTPQNGPSSER